MKYGDYSRNTTFSTASKGFRLSKLPQPKIKFNFFFKSDYINIFQNQKFTILPSKKQSASAVVAVEEGSDTLFEDMVEAFVEAIGNRLFDEDLEDLIDLAWAEVRKVFPPKTLMPEYNVLYLHFDVRSEHRYVYGDCPPKIPSAGVKEERRCCCICLEEVEGGDGGGGALRMPCLHLFHSGCIKAWLRKSSCCPLCRYQMPKM